MSHPTRARRRWYDGAPVAVAAAVGLLIGVRAVLTFQLPRPRALVRLEHIPRESLGLRWSERALWPADLQAAALDGLVTLVAGLALAALAIATLNALILLAESAANRRAELAVRIAVGATPTALAGMLLRELRPLLATGLALGGVLGLAAGGTARAAWPGPTAQLSAPSALAQIGFGLAVVVGLLVVAHVTSALRVARAERSAPVLRAGGRTADDPGAIFVRKALTVVHVGLAGSVVIGMLTLGGALGGEPTTMDGSPATVDGSPATIDGSLATTHGTAETIVIDATSPGPDAWAELRERLRRVSGLEAESLSTPGTLVGLGVRDYALAECGRCSRGGLPAPLWSAVVDHHAVTPGFFELAGVEIVDGRAIEPSDGPGAEPIAVVSRSFAYSSFENGDPVGKRVRLGSGFEDWYTVVGVVEDLRVPVPGADDLPREAVYLSALQRPPRAGTVLLRGDANAIRGARAVMESLGLGPGPARTLTEHRAVAAAPLAWAHGGALALALAALALGAHGVYATAVQATRRRVRDVAIRRAMGARSRHVAAYVLGERARITCWGLAGMLFGGTLVVGLLRKTAGMAPLGPAGYGAVAALLLATALAASARALREALAVDPATLLD
jgi:hypothetical protein